MAQKNINMPFWSKRDLNFPSFSDEDEELNKAIDILGFRSTLDALSEQILPNITNRFRNAEVISFLLKSLDYAKSACKNKHSEFERIMKILENLYLIYYDLQYTKSKQLDKTKDITPLGCSPGNETLRYLQDKCKPVPLDKWLYATQHTQGLFASYKSPLYYPINPLFIKKTEWGYELNEERLNGVGFRFTYSQKRVIKFYLAKSYFTFNTKNQNNLITTFSNMLTSSDKQHIKDILLAISETNKTYGAIKKYRYKPNNDELQIAKGIASFLKKRQKQRYKQTLSVIVALIKIQESAQKIGGIFNKILKNSCFEGISIDKLIKDKFKDFKKQVFKKDIKTTLNIFKQGLIPKNNKSNSLYSFLIDLSKANSLKKIIVIITERQNIKPLEKKLFELTDSNKKIVLLKEELPQLRFIFAIRIGAMLSLKKGIEDKNERY